MNTAVVKRNTTPRLVGSVVAGWLVVSVWAVGCTKPGSSANSGPGHSPRQSPAENAGASKPEPSTSGSSAPTGAAPAEPPRQPVNEQAVKSVRAVFETRKVKPELFSQPFDPAKRDPLLLEAAWAIVRPDVEKALKDSLKLKEKPTLRLYVITRKQGKEAVPAFAVPFLTPEEVVATFCAAIGYDRADFPRLTPLAQAVIIAGDNVRPEYKKNGRLNPVLIRNALVALVQDDSAIAKDFKLVPKVTVLDERLGSFQLVTTPIRIEQSLTQDYAHFWRLHVRLDRAKGAEDWTLGIRIDVGSVPLSNVKDLSKINFRDPNSNTDFNDALRRVRLLPVKGPKTASRLKLRAVYQSKQTSLSAVDETVNEPEEVSSLGRAADLLYDECRKKFLKAEEK